MENLVRIVEEKVEGLARAIAEAINEVEIAGQPGVRAELKDFAISVLEDALVPVEPAAVTTVNRAEARFNPLGMGIPLFFAGGVLIFLFPPVGAMLFVASAVMVVWG